MKYTDLRDAIGIRKPRYSEKFRPMIESISIKGAISAKGDISSFGALYQTYMYAYIIGLRLGEKSPFSDECEKAELVSFSNWKPARIRDFVLITLLNRAEKFEVPYNWYDLENADKEVVSNFVSMIIRELELYANTGFMYLQNIWDNEKYQFNRPFVFVDILQELPYKNLEVLKKLRSNIDL